MPEGSADAPPGRFNTPMNESRTHREGSPEGTPPAPYLGAAPNVPHLVTNYGHGSTEGLFKAARDRYQRSQDGKPLGVRTPFKRLNELLGGDQRLGGFQPGQVYVLGAPPGTGKSSLAMNFCRQVCRNGGRALYLAYEVGPDACRSRALSDIASVTGDNLQAGKFDPDALERFAPQLEAETSQIMFVDATVDPRPSAASMAKTIVTGRGEDPYGFLVVVDYLQLAARFAGYDDVRDVRDKVAKFSNDLSRVARSCNVPVLALASVGRAHYKADQKDTEISLGIFKEAGDIESDADVALALWPKSGTSWDELRGQDSWPLDLHVLKNRHGRTGKGRVDFIRPYQRFTEPQR